MTSESDEVEIDIFQEPADFYQPEKQPTFASHQLLSGTELRIRLVGHNPLWVRYLLADVKHMTMSPSSLFPRPPCP
jgi:nicotinamide N-methyltransferase